MALIIGGTDDTDPWNNEKANLVSLIGFQAQKSSRNAIFIKKKKKRLLQCMLKAPRKTDKENNKNISVFWQSGAKQ